MENYSSLLVILIAVFIALEYKAGNKIAKNDSNIQLKKNERFRTLKMQLLEPLLAIIVVGSLLLTDISKSPVHIGVAVLGAIIGYIFGAYRAKVTYVKSIHEHKGVILRYSIESIMTLVLLIIIKLLAENNLLPDTGIFPYIVSGLLAFLLLESISRVYSIVRHYKKESKSIES